MVSKAKAHPAPRYINSDQQSETTSGTTGHGGRILAKRRYSRHSRILTKSGKYESTSGRHSRVDQSRILPAMDKAKAKLVPRCINSDHKNKSTSRTADYDGRAKVQLAQLYINKKQKKRKHGRTTQPCRPERHINRDEQSESIAGTAGYQQRAAKRSRF